MSGNKRWFLALLAAVLLFAFAVDVAAQAGVTIVFGQPLAGQIAAGQTLSYDYTLTEPRQITLQALGDTAQPTITILSNGEVVAQQANTEGALTTSLNALLNAGSYVVQVGAANNTAGLVVLVLQSETAVTSQALALASPLPGSVDPSAPLALYSFSALAEPAFLYVESGAPTSGVSVSLVNSTTGAVSGQIESDLLGARFRVPAGTDAYQVEVHHSGTGAPVSFTVCLAAVSSGGCEAGTAPLQTPEVPSDVYVPCTVAPAAAGGVNIYQSASTSAIIRESLPDGAIADVIGISPDQQFYNVLYRGTNGWIAVSTVASSGDCGIDTILIINPPAIIPATNLQAPTQPPPLPTIAIPTIVVPPQPIGPCLITMIGDQLIYTQPNAIPDYIYDQVHPGYELIPTGRLADNSWWKTNYADSWIQTAVFGTTAQVSGNCVGLPIISP